MLGSRLLIGMKEAGARDVNFASGASSTLMVKTVSQMQFMGGSIRIPAGAQEMSGFSTSMGGFTDADELPEKAEVEKSV